MAQSATESKKTLHNSEPSQYFGKFQKFIRTLKLFKLSSD